MPLRSLIVLAALPTAVVAAPTSPSGPDDPDLKLDAACPGGPGVAELRAAIPLRIPELVVRWRRLGKTREAPCQTVGRVTVIDHRGVVITLSFVFSKETPPAEFTPWFADDGEPKPAAGRTGPPRNELVWVPNGAEGMHVLLAGSPSTSHDTLEGATSFLSREGVLDTLVALNDRN